MLQNCIRKSVANKLQRIDVILKVARCSGDAADQNDVDGSEHCG
jgi:hypothetical protein